MDTYKDRVTLHVFYGVACTGKSTLALRFAHEHSIRTIIHTDYVREVQRAFAQQSEGSPLMKVTHNAWELFGEPSTENIVKGFTKHVDAVTPALLAIVRKLSKDGFDAIVEGVHCYSDVLDQIPQVGGLIVLPRLLVVTSESGLLDHMQHKEEERSRSGEAKAWKNQTKTLMKIQDFLIQDATQRNIPIICTD
jgi:2-phosphoglycerate kinase